MVFDYSQIFNLVDRFISETESPKNNNSQKLEVLSFNDFQQLNNSQTEAQQELARNVYSILSKAPRSFFAEINREVCAKLLLSAFSCLDQIIKDPDFINVRSFTEAGHNFLIVALKDQPFIINTFNNLFETLQISPPAILHPILEVSGISISLSILYFDSISQQDLQNSVDHLQKVLPILKKVCADFPQMNQASIELWNKLKACNQSENADFIAWLGKGRIAFIGFTKYQFSESRNFSTKNFIQFHGLLDCKTEVSEKIIHDILQDYSLIDKEMNFSVSKVSCLSPVHYRRRLLHFAFVLPDSREIYSFLGLWTSRAINEEATTAPVLRRKVESFFDQSDLLSRGHDFKAITRAINLTPKHHILASSVEQIKTEIQLLQQVEFSGQSHGSLRLDAARRGALATFVIRTDNFSAELKENLQKKLEIYFNSNLNQSDFYLTSLNEKTCRLYFYCPLGEGFQSQYASPGKLQGFMQELLESILGWRGHLELLLEDHYGASVASKIHKHYQSVFTNRYQALTTPSEAILDIELCQSLAEDYPVRVRLDQTLEDHTLGFGTLEPTLTIARLGCPFKLSQVLPILENLNFVVLDSETIELSLPDSAKGIYLHRFSLENNLPSDFDINHFQDVTATVIERVLGGFEENDSLNSLLVQTRLDVQAVKALRLLYNLLWQIRKSSTRLSLRSCLTNNPKSAVLLWKMFEVRFDPCLQIELEERNELLQKYYQDLQQELKSVKDISDDASIKAYALIIMHSVRTNFFSQPKTMAIKIHSRELPILRGTKPLYETFVYSEQVEGVHLRSSKIARGGIRWSDRREDYRTEVLGLMRVQRIKNAIVVPSGAKGGFIVKEGAKLATNRELVIASYKNYIRALLSLSDNVKDGKTITPENLVVYDQPDPYLVVAADKGTASFSDYANQVATEEFGFWLGDGFASGGSKGYSHKELGITARGAWECAKRHFIELNIDHSSCPFTVVGIGDMSGDVFGNGLLLSRKMKLIAAFDHRHIFIDPNPDLETAYTERKRLFDLPRSAWSDYSKQSLSKGGAIYDRNEKEITLSEEAKIALAIPDEFSSALSSEQLISCILKAPVDLLWNGGIGTYVKASAEVDSEISDSANDGVRVNASELRCKIVAEGGNLGFTQAARIEYALRGGRINTDAIDNSAGVDLSDHEVNLKILFHQLIQEKLCTTEDRDAILSKISQSVAESCLLHNRNQSFVISVAETASRKSLDYFKALIRELSQRSYINRAIDGLPSDDEIEKRALKRTGLSRPEICIFLAGMKLWIKDEIINSGLAEDPSVVQFGLNYFPTTIQEQYTKQILSHKLFKNIIASELSNHLVDVFGITFLHRLQLSEGIDFAGALRASVAASLILDATGIMKELEPLDNFEYREEYREGRLDLGKALRILATQLIHRFSSKLEISGCIKLYKLDSAVLLSGGENCFGQASIKDCFRIVKSKRIQKGLPENLSNSLSFCHLFWLGLDAIDLSKSRGISVTEAHSLLINIWEELKIEFLILGQLQIVAQSLWEHELLLSTYDRLRASVAKIAESIFEQLAVEGGAIDYKKARKILSASKKIGNLELIVAEFKNSPNLSILHALARYLDNFSLV